MPMPEGLSELTFAGDSRRGGFPVPQAGRLVHSTDADFCILAETAPDSFSKVRSAITSATYSGKHPFPYLRVKQFIISITPFFRSPP